MDPEGNRNTCAPNIKFRTNKIIITLSFFNTRYYFDYF